MTMQLKHLDSRSNIVLLDNNYVNLSLSKTLASPKRCHNCRRVVFFKSYRCKLCKHRHQHKKCSTRCCKSNGEEHWTKVLQANETPPCTLATHSQPYTHTPLTSQMSAPACHPAAHPSHTTCPSVRPVSRSSSRHSTSSSLSSTGRHSTSSRRDANIFSHFFTKIARWVGSNRRYDSEATLQNDLLSRTSSTNSFNQNHQHSQDHELFHSWLQSAESPQPRLHKTHMSISSEDSDLGSQSGGSFIGHDHIARCYSTTSTSSQRTSASSSSTTTDICHPGDSQSSLFGHHHDSDVLHSNKTLVSSMQESPHRQSPHRQWHRLMTVSHGSQYAQEQWANVPLGQRQTKNLNTSFRSKHSSSLHDRYPAQKSPGGLTSTWPPGDRISHSLEDNLSLGLRSVSTKADDELNTSVFEDGTEFGGSDICLRETLAEFHIPHKDLTFGKKSDDIVSIGRRAHIYKGNWHGEVMIHTYKDLRKEEVESFWKDVSRMALIRHDNVALFMGASLDPPHLAIITSVRKAKSLHNKIHLATETINPQRLMSIIQQITQGMGYLHAKGIVMTKLNSHNISLEPKVKICLMDYGMAQARFDRRDKACLPQGHLTYIAPEIMRTLRVECPRLVSHTAYTNYSDIYAFGTLLYELLTYQYPLRHQTPEAIIWQLASGKQQSLTHLKCTATLKHIIDRCWSYDPESRPQFVDITRELGNNMTLHKTHSSSEPELLNRAGVSIY